ncbi:MAG: HEAT repeat domain-containing protein [Planctomycetes bacterium]|nr:HEAT repeat domain-containing protein [Planctomycetota bacterium]
MDCRRSLWAGMGVLGIAVVAWTRWSSDTSVRPHESELLVPSAIPPRGVDDAGHSTSASQVSPSSTSAEPAPSFDSLIETIRSGRVRKDRWGRNSPWEGLKTRWLNAAPDAGRLALSRLGEPGKQPEELRFLAEVAVDSGLADLRDGVLAWLPNAPREIDQYVLEYLTLRQWDLGETVREKIGAILLADAETLARQDDGHEIRLAPVWAALLTRDDSFGPPLLRILSSACSPRMQKTCLEVLASAPTERRVPLIKALMGRIGEGSPLRYRLLDAMATSQWQGIVQENVGTLLTDAEESRSADRSALASLERAMVYYRDVMPSISDPVLREKMQVLATWSTASHAGRVGVPSGIVSVLREFAVRFDSEIGRGDFAEVRTIASALPSLAPAERVAILTGLSTRPGSLNAFGVVKDAASSDPDEGVRGEAVTLLGYFRFPSYSVPLLESIALGDSSTDVRRSAIRGFALHLSGFGSESVDPSSSKAQEREQIKSVMFRLLHGDQREEVLREIKDTLTTWFPDDPNVQAALLVAPSAPEGKEAAGVGPIPGDE